MIAGRRTAAAIHRGPSKHTAAERLKPCDSTSDATDKYCDRSGAPTVLRQRPMASRDSDSSLWRPAGRSRPGLRPAPHQGRSLADPLSRFSLRRGKPEIPRGHTAHAIRWLAVAHVEQPRPSTSTPCGRESAHGAAPAPGRPRFRCRARSRIHPPEISIAHHVVSRVAIYRAARPGIPWTPFCKPAGPSSRGSRFAVRRMIRSRPI